MPGSFREYDIHSARETPPIKQPPRKRFMKTVFHCRQVSVCSQLLLLFFIKDVLVWSQFWDRLCTCSWWSLTKELLWQHLNNMCHHYHTLHWPEGSLQLHFEDLHFVAINNWLIMFGKVKKITCWKAIYRGFDLLGNEYSELKLNKISHVVNISHKVSSWF